MTACHGSVTSDCMVYCPRPAPVNWKLVLGTGVIGGVAKPGGAPLDRWWDAEEAIRAAATASDDVAWTYTIVRVVGLTTRPESYTPSLVYSRICCSMCTPSVPPGAPRSILYPLACLHIHLPVYPLVHPVASCTPLPASTFTYLCTPWCTP
jgi:hypothetical protein